MDLHIILACSGAGLIGYANMNRPNPLRFTGALGTYLAGAGLCLALVMGG